MAFTWQIPYQPPDQTAIDRMKHHFPKPSELMPYAWFMTGEATFLTWLGEMPAEEIPTKDLSRVFFEIWSGIKNFPNVPYIDVWAQWFKYLLPYAITAINTDKDGDWLLSNTFEAFMKISPEQIVDEYSEFRDDVVYTLGTRIVPQVLSRDDPALKTSESASLQNPVFNDIWDFTNSPGMETPGIYDEFSFPMRFCLKYLTPSEIDIWVESLVKIDSPQWHLAIVTWWLREYHSRTSDYTIPSSNALAFDAAITRCLTHDLFLVWATDIRSHQTFQYIDGTFPISEKLRISIERDLERFEQLFFHNL